MKAPSTASRVILVLVAILLLMLSATLAWGLVVDYQNRGLVPKGVTVAGTDLSGMNSEEARAAIEDAVSAPALRPLVVQGNGHSWKFDSSEAVTVDVDAMLDEAYSSRREATLARRLSSQLTGTPLTLEVQPRTSVDTTAIAEWVDKTAQEVDRKPRNATREVDGYEFKITPSRKGLQVDQKKAVAAIADALSTESALSADGQRSVALAIKTTKPRIDESDFKQGIIVSLARCKVYFYEGEELVRTYRCAPGRPAFPTPTGDFKVIRKLAYAPWINPGSDWAKDMPASIPPGPNNPMGVHKVGINYPGIYFHGIPPNEFSSIGTHASHGCMRMMPSEVHDLYDRVEVGTEVFIRNY